jgi:hypothetical protein
MQEYRRRLAAHDWYFDYSDDQKAWRAGRDERNALYGLAHKLDPKFEVWKEYAPKS